MKKFVRVATLALCALTLPVWANLLPATATTTNGLFLNLNASDPASYSSSAPRAWNDIANSPPRVGAVVGTSGVTYNATDKALAFPGGTNSTNSLGYVDMGAGFSNFGSGITIEFEGHFGGVNQDWERIFDFGNGDANDNIWVGVLGDYPAYLHGPLIDLPNRLAIEVWNNELSPAYKPGICYTTDQELTTNSFDKWAITLDGTTCRMYKNGTEVNVTRWTAETLVATDDTSLGVAYPFLPRNVTRLNNYIGRSNWGTDAAFDGAIKYVRIYSRALTDTEAGNNATTYTLTYATTGSNLGNAPASQTGNGLITLSGNTGDLKRSGHFFNGWTATEGGATAISSPYNLTANTTLHPVWIPIPSAPIISVSRASSTSLSAAITAPAINASSVDGYRVETSTDGTTWTLASNNVAANESSYTITGLTTGTPYYVRVAAKYVGQLSAYGYNWQPIYEVTSPKRNSGAIVYADGFGLGINDAATTASNNFTRVRYRMAATNGGVNNYVDANFSRTLGTKTTYSESFDSIARLRVPTTSSGNPGDTSNPNHFEIHANVSDLNVESNVSGLQNGAGLTGRLEIWPWNYDVAAANDLTARTTNVYDDSDQPILNVSSGSEYGSFQLHQLSDTPRTIFAWNRHFRQDAQDIGFGQYTETYVPTQSLHTDWTFAAENNGYVTPSNFNLKIFVDVPVTPTATTFTISYSAGTGGTGSAPSSPTSVTEGSTFTTPVNTYTRDGYTFAGWSDGVAAYLAGVTYPATGAVTGNVALTATWTANTLTVTTNEQGGNDLANLTTTTGGSIPSPGTPTRDGYTFNGWFTASAGGTAINFPYTHGQTENFTLFAQWTAVTPEQNLPDTTPNAPSNTGPTDNGTATDPDDSNSSNVATNTKSDGKNKSNTTGNKQVTDSSSDLPITGEQIAAKLLVALMAIVGGSLLLWRRRLLT